MGGKLELRKISEAKAAAIRTEIYRNNFSPFIRKCFETVSTGNKYIHNWHIDAICEYLKACERQEIKRLVINIPPRSLKTITVSVGWSAWLMGKNPSAQIIGASYSQDLAYKDNVNTRYIIESDWYRECFPHTVLQSDQNEKRKFSTTLRGHRLATSVGGTLTGEGGDYLILDDPIKPDAAMSDTMRVKTNEWIDQVFMSRMNNPKKGVAVLVMQRVHEDDAAGHLLEKGWEHLCIPAEFDKPKTYSIGSKRWDIKANTLLIPDHIDQETLERTRVDIGSYGYAAQYLQQPAPIGGGLIKKDWLQYYGDQPSGFTRIVHSWDTASKDGVLNDPTCGTVWGVKNNGYYLLDVINERMQFPELKKKVLDIADRDKPDTILIEDKDSGQALIQELRQTTTLPIIPVQPNKDKVTRCSHVSVEFEIGNVMLPMNAIWVKDYVSQLTLFPNAKHDDMVDSTTQFLLWVKGKSFNSSRKKARYDEHGMPTFDTMLGGQQTGRRRI